MKVQNRVEDNVRKILDILDGQDTKNAFLALASSVVVHTIGETFTREESKMRIDKFINALLGIYNASVCKIVPPEQYPPGVFPIRGGEK